MAEMNALSKIFFNLFSLIQRVFVYIMKTLFPKLCDFLISQFSQYQGVQRASIPSVSIFVNYTSSIRKTNPADAKDVVKLTKGKSVYIKCTITNQGQTDLLMVKINKHRLRVPQMESGGKYTFHIKMKPASRDIEVILQNASNHTYAAPYAVVYHPKSNTTKIEQKRGFRYAKDK